jgi:hypothetical protein
MSFNVPPIPLNGKEEKKIFVATDSMYLVLFFLITCHMVAAPIDMSTEYTLDHSLLLPLQPLVDRLDRGRPVSIIDRGQ